MKIKFIKSIPGYEEGEIINLNPDAQYGMFFTSGNEHILTVKSLVDDGWCEIVEDAINIDDIRRNSSLNFLSDGNEIGYVMTSDEAVWFEAYSVVRNAIHILNDKFPSKYNPAHNFFPVVNPQPNNEIFSWDVSWHQKSILPTLRSKKGVLTLIELCEKELKILFGIERK